MKTEGGKIRQTTTNEIVKNCDATCMDICHMICAKRVSLTRSRVNFFKKTIDSIANGKWLVPPSYHETGFTFLGEE